MHSQDVYDDSFFSPLPAFDSSENQLAGHAHSFGLGAVARALAQAVSTARSGCHVSQGDDFATGLGPGEFNA
jgi:hypothetical protein